MSQLPVPTKNKRSQTFSLAVIPAYHYCQSQPRTGGHKFPFLRNSSLAHKSQFLMPTLAYHTTGHCSSSRQPLQVLRNDDPGPRQDQADHRNPVLSYYAPPLPGWAGALANASIVQQFICMHQCNAKLITHATIATDDANTPIYFAGLGDKIENFVPVSFSAAYLTSDVVTLIATNEVELYKLPVSDEDPFQLEDLTPTDGGEGTPPGPNRLQFDFIMAVDAPKMVCCPVLMPLPPGIFFTDGIVFAERDKLTVEEMQCKPARIWYKGIR